MDEDEIEVAPCEEDLFTVDESLPPVEAILRYSNSNIPAQRHAYIKGMGAAALRCNSAADACRLIHAALRLLPESQEGKGSHGLAGDELAEVLILQQLGTLGRALLWLSCTQPESSPSPDAALAPTSNSLHGRADTHPARAPPSGTSSNPGSRPPSPCRSLDPVSMQSVHAMAGACAHRISACDAEGGAADHLSPSAWPAAWCCNLPPQLAGDAAASADEGSDDARSAALQSYSQLLGLLPRQEACQAASQHVRQALLGSAQAPAALTQMHGVRPPASTSMTAQREAVALPQPDPGTAQHLPLELALHIEPRSAATALSLLAACGHATQGSCFKVALQSQDECDGPGSRQAGEDRGGSLEALSDVAARLLLRLAEPAKDPALVSEAEACQMVAVAHLLPLATSLLCPTPATFDAVLLPVLQALVASVSWAVRRKVVEVLPVLLAVLVGEGGRQAGKQDGDMGQGAAAVLDVGAGEAPQALLRGCGVDEGAPGAGQAGEGGEGKGGSVSDFRQGQGEAGISRLRHAACLILQQARAKQGPSKGLTAKGRAVRGQESAEEQEDVVRAGRVPGRGTSNVLRGAGEESRHCDCQGQQLQQQNEEVQRMCEAVLDLLVVVLGTKDVSHWVRSAAVSAAGPALCVLPSWLAAQQTSLHALYAEAVLAARPHTQRVVVTCASCLGAVVAKVGAQVWSAPASPFPMAYSSLMRGEGGAGGMQALQATVAQLPTLAAVLGAAATYEQLLPLLIELLPGRLAELRGALASRSALARLATVLPPPGASQLLALLPGLCSLDEGKEEGRCGLWRERHGLAVQLADLAWVAIRASNSHSNRTSASRSKQGTDSAAIPSCNGVRGFRCEADLLPDVQHEALIRNPLLHHASSQSPELSQLNCGEMVEVVLFCASTLIEDPVWAVRQATVEQLSILTQLTD